MSVGRSETSPTFNQGWLTPQLPQRQDSLTDQLRDVAAIANRMGCYDAADWITAAPPSPLVGADDEHTSRGRA